MERTIRKGECMRSQAEVEHTLKEMKLEEEKEEYVNGEPEMYYNKGWIEALEYVLGPKLYVTSDLQVKVK